MAIRVLIILFLSCSCLFGQTALYAPFTKFSSGSSFSFDTNTIPGAYIIAFADSAADWQGHTDGSVADAIWIDRSGLGNHLCGTNAIVGGSGDPLYSSTQGATNGYNVDFTTATSTTSKGLSLSANFAGSSQPNCYIFFISLNSGAVSQNLIDSRSGSRNLGPYFNTTAGADGKDNLYAGSFGHLSQPYPSGSNWVVTAMMFNGATSWCLTNNVNWGGIVNPGAQAMTRPQIGGDNGNLTGFTGRMQACIAIATSNSNLVRTVCYQVAKKYGYTIPQ